MPTLKKRKKATPDRNGSRLDEVLLDLLPPQGRWSEEAYLLLPDFSAHVDAVFDAD